LIEQLAVVEDERLLADIEPDSAHRCEYFIDTSSRSNGGDQKMKNSPTTITKEPRQRGAP